MLVHWPTFIASLAIGLFFVYMTNAGKQVIVVYPTPENVRRIQYKDRAGTCYNLQASKGQCPKNKSTVSKIPVQHTTV